MPPCSAAARTPAITRTTRTTYPPTEGERLDPFDDDETGATVTFYAEHLPEDTEPVPDDDGTAPGHAAVHYWNESSSCDLLVGRRALGSDQRVVVKVFEGLDETIGDSVRDYLIRAASRASHGGVDVAIAALGLVMGATEDELVEQLGWYFGVDVDRWTPDLFAWFLKMLGGQELPPGVLRLPSSPERFVTFGAPARS